MTVRADGRMRRTSARRSAVRCKYVIPPAYPRSSHSRKNASSGRAPAGAMPHASNPRRRAYALTSEAVMDLRVTSPELRAPPHQLSQHVRQDPAVAEGDELLRGVDPCRGGESNRLAVIPDRLH